MSETNPFEAPAVVSAASAAPAAVALPFEPVGIWKIWVLTVATFGLYPTFWLWRNFRRQRSVGADLWPWARALFQVFFVHDLFRSVERSSRAGDVSLSGLATVYVVMTIVSNLYERASMELVHSAPSWALSLALLLARAFALVRAQHQIDRVLDDLAPDRDRNRRIGAGLVVLLVVGGGGWLLVLVGLLLPAPP